MEAAHIRWRPLGRLLVEQGLLTEDDLERALTEQATTGRRLGETLVELGFVSHAALSKALAAQYGFGGKAETGFGTGLRAQLERRFEQEREGAAVPRLRVAGPALTLVTEAAAAEPEPVDDEESYLAPLEEQWAKLAAAEEQLAETQRELAALRQQAARRRAQAVRLVARIRSRDRRPAALSTPVEASPETSSTHLVYAQLADGYVLVEREGEPPEPEAVIELPELGEHPFVVARLGRSPLPRDARPCVFVQQAP